MNTFYVGGGGVVMLIVAGFFGVGQWP